MSRQRGRVLVIGSDTRAFLAVARSLGRAGVEVEATGLAREAPAARSSYVAAVHELPGYAGDGEAWLREMTALLDERRMDLLVPCPDWAVVALDRFRASLEPLARLAVPGSAALTAFMDKRATRDIADRLGVRAPAEWRFEAGDSLSALDGEPLPLVVKPASSFDPAEPLAKRAVVTASSRAELEAAVEREARQGTAIVQRRVAGVGVGVELLVSDGETLAAFQHERVHEPLGGGGSSYRRSVALDPELLAASRRMVAEVSYSGVAMVEFKREAETYWLMEVNPRFWGSLPLAVAAGADFPAALYELLVEGRRPARWDPVEGLYCRNLLADARWWGHALRSGGGLGQAQPLRDSIRLAGRAIRGRERLDTLTRDDPRPALGEMRGLLSAGVAAAIPRLAAWPPLRRLLGARARRRLREAASIVFLCRGNVCRSPFAEAVLAEHRERARIISAGTFPREGRPVPSEALAAAERLGVDLSTHRSRVADRRALRQADAVFLFDRRDWVSGRDLGVSPRRLHFVGSVDRDGPLEIADPWGRGEEAMVAAYARIRRALDFAFGPDR